MIEQMRQSVQLSSNHLRWSFLEDIAMVFGLDNDVINEMP